MMSWDILLLSLALTTGVIEGVRFTELYKAVNVDEGTPLGTYIATVMAIAEFGQVPGNITYSLQGAHKDYFQINSSGVITTAAILDSEAFPTSLLQLTVRANKPGESQGSMTLVITLRDLNDNIPQFINSPYQVNVSEATKINEVVAIVTVVDRDKHPNNEVELKIVSGDTDGVFSIDETSTPQRGLIKLKKPLDFEGPNKIYHLNVTATDLYGTGNKNWTTVTITVVNDDDNGPTFRKYLYEVLIDTNTPKGLEFVKVHAEDKDFDPVSYSIHPASDPEKTFTINNLTGSIYVENNLTQVMYHLIVTAESRSLSPNPEIFPPAFALVIVRVGNMPNRTFKSSVMENEANTLALDLKPVEQYFNVSNPVFSILRGNAGNMFVINQTTKELRVGGQGLDREQSAQHSLVVELRSNGINRGFARIDVNVLDANDNSPQFLNSTSVSVREDMSPGTVILKVMASDRDAEKNGAVVYEIVDGNGQGFFALNNQSGALSLSRPLDYETAVLYVLNISASDSGEPRLQSFTYVSVHVTDVNDNSPVLHPRSVRVSLVEGSPPGSYVTQCNATDADSAVNAKITYLIVEGAANKFSIDKVTGVITTTGQFDRESGVSEYVLVVKAQDQGQYPRADVGFVTINIIDKNEHSPVISPSSFLGAVYKETTYYSLVTTIKATDADFDSNSVISYDIVSGDGADYFHVEPHTGHVRVACSLAEKKDVKYTLEVSASDGGKTSDNNAMVDIFLLSDEDSVILTAGVTPQEITKKRQEFVGILEIITGGKAFIKHLVPGDGKNSTLVAFHAVKDKNVMTGSEIISFFSANEEALETTYKHWNIQGYQSPVTLAPEAQKGNGHEQLSAVVGAMICLGVIIGLAAIIMIITLIRRKQTGKSPFKKKRKPRVQFNDTPTFYDPDHGALATSQVETAQEAQEVIIHIPAEDSSSLEGSETSSQSDVFINFGIAAAREAMREKDPDEISVDQCTFFPPPPTGPPPPPPDSDSESDENDENVIADASEIYREEYATGEDNPNAFRQDDEGEVVGIVLSQSPPGSTTGSMTQLVNEGPRWRVASSAGSFFRKFSLNESRTDL